MNNRQQRQMSESIYLGILLAIVGGYLDIYTYILRDKVFANAQTGNMILLGLNIANGKLKEAMFYIIPILAFVLGVWISEWIKKNYKDNTIIHWRQISILVEIIVLFIVGFIPNGSFNMIANVLISFVCSMQVESFRKMNGLIYATTMCTGNLRSATELLWNYKTTKDVEARNRALHYLVIIFSFIIGAILGSLGSRYFGLQSIWLCCAILVFVFIAMFQKDS